MRICYIMLILLLVPLTISGDTYNRDEKVPITLNLNPGDALTGTADWTLQDYEGNTITTGSLSAVTGMSNLVYYGTYTINDTLDDNTYSLILEWTVSGTDYKQIGTFEVNVLEVALADTTQGDGYITQDDCGGSIVLSNGIPAHNATLKVYITGTNTLFRRINDATDSNGDFIIWLPISNSYDIEAIVAGYSGNRCSNITPHASE